METPQDKIKIVWSKTAYSSFHNFLVYIQEDSINNAIKVKSEIFATIRNLSRYPEKFPLDKYKTNNNGQFRAFEKFRLRVSYKYSKAEIRILRVRSTDQKTKKY